MSNANVFLPKSFAARFVGKSADDLVRFCTDVQFSGLADSEPVKASMIRLNRETAIAGMGGKATAHSFIDGLLWHVARFAYGANPADLQKGLTPIGQFALVAACGSIKQGAGITLGVLRDSVTIGLGKALALPEKQKDAAPTVAAPTVAAPTVAAPVALVWDMDQGGTTPSEWVQETQGESKFLSLLDDEARDRKERADTLARLHAEAVARYAAHGRDNAAKAHAFAQLANDLGIKLTKAQVARLDAVQKEHVASAKAV